MQRNFQYFCRKFEIKMEHIIFGPILLLQLWPYSKQIQGNGQSTGIRLIINTKQDFHWSNARNEY